MVSAPPLAGASCLSATNQLAYEFESLGSNLGAVVSTGRSSSTGRLLIEMANLNFIRRGGTASNGTQTGFFANVIDEVFPGHFITGGVSRSFSGVANSDFIDRTSADTDDTVLENSKMPDDVLGPQFAPEIPLQLNFGYNYLYRPTKRYSFSFDAVTSFGLSNADRDKFFKGIGATGSLQY